MKIIPSQINDAATRRAPGFIEAFKAVAKDNQTHWEIEKTDLAALNLAWPVQRARPMSPGEAMPRPSTRPVRQHQVVWPMNPFGFAARALKLLRQPADAGVGDTIARVIGPIGGERYKAWFKDTFGKTCGCTERQEQLNHIYPYEKTA